MMIRMGSGIRNGCCCWWCWGQS